MLEIERLKEYCAWEIAHDKIVGVKFINICYIKDGKIGGFYINRYGPQKPTFSQATGKEINPYSKNEYLWLTERKVNKQKYLEKI